jgi:hypothetical protein
MFFIILAAALTLHIEGKTDITTSRQAAEALKPFAGEFAAALYAVGIIAVGVLAIPTLAGSAAFAFSETMQWRHGLSRTFHAAARFYNMIFLSIGLGAAINRPRAPNPKRSGPTSRFLIADAFTDSPTEAVSYALITSKYAAQRVAGRPDIARGPRGWRWCKSPAAYR